MKLVVATAVCAALAYAVFNNDTARTALGRDPDGSEAQATLEDPELDAPRTRDAAEERRRLSALRQVLLTRVLTAAQPEADEQRAAEAPPVNPLVRATRTLDERMLNASASGKGEEMERALQAVLDSGFLGDTVAALFCGATMCRVDLSDEDNARVSQAARAFAERVPKMFGAMAAYPLGTGETAIYVALNSDDLMLGALPAELDSATAEALPTEQRTEAIAP